MNYQNKSNEELISELLLVRQELDSLKRLTKQESHGRKQAETDILPEQERPNYMKESSFYGFWDWDIPSGRVYFSPKWKAMLGFAGSEIENTHEAWSKRVHLQDLDTVLLALNRHLAGETDSYRSEHRILCKDGSYTWIHDEGKVVEKDFHGKPLRVMGTFTEITHYKKTEHDLQERMKELNCHNRISEVMSNTRLSTGDVIGKTLLLIPEAWQFPEITHASVQIQDSVYQTPGFLRSENSLVKEIRVNKSTIGRIEVCYSAVSTVDSPPEFLPEEADLLFSIAERLGNYIQRNENDRALSENEQKYRELVENITDVIYKIDSKGIITYISSAIEKIIGYRAEEIIGKNFAPFVGINDEYLFQRLKELSLKNELDNEYKILSRTGQTRWIRLATKAVFLDGVLSGAYGTLFDITEKKRIELELQKSESLYRSVLNASPDIITITDLEGKILITSPRTFDMFGYTASDFGPDSSLLDFIDPKDHARARYAIVQMHQDNFTGVAEYTGIKSDGSTFDIEVNGEFIRDGEGHRNSMIFITRDISDRKLAEEKIRKSEDQFRNIVESISDVVFEISIDGTISYVSPSIVRILGLMPIDLIGQNFSKYVYPDDLPFLINIFNKNHFDEFKYIEYRCLTNEGEIRWVQISARSIVENGILTGRTGILHEITDQKIASEKLRKSEEQYRHLVESINEAIYEISIDGIIKYASPCIEKMLGYTPDELIGKNAFSLMHPDDVAAAMDALSSLGNLDLPYLDHRYRTKSGGICWVRTSTTPVFENGLIIGGTGTLTDINQSKLAESALLDSEEKFSIAFRTAPYAITITNANDGKFFEINDAFTVHTGYTREEAYADSSIGLKLWADIDERNRVVADLSAGKEVLSREYNFVKKNGDIAVCIYSASVISLSGKPYILSSITDISEIKRAQEKLRQLSLAVEQSPVSIVITNLKGYIEYANPKTCETTGYALDELVGQNPRVLKSGETLTSEYEALWGNISTGSEWRGVFHNKKKSGELYWESSTISPITNGDGQITHYLAIKEDISSRILNEAALLKSEDRFRQVAEQSRTVVWDVDASGLFTYVSPMALSVWGYSPDQLIGKLHFYDLCPIERRAQSELAALESFARKETLHNMENQVVTSDNRVITISTNGIPLLDENDNLIGYRGADKDITEQKKAEDLLVQSEEALNYAQEIAKMGSWELDMVTNELKGSKNLFRLLGLGAEETKISNDHFLKMIHPDDHHIIAEKIQQVNRNRCAASMKMRMVLPNGDIKFIQNSMVPSFDGDTLLNLKGVLIDITDKKLAEAALRMNEAALNQAQEISKMCSWELNLITEKLTWSKNYYQLMGIPHGTDISPNFFKEKVHPQDLHLVDEKLEEMRLLKKPVTYDLRLRMPGDVYKWVENNIVPEFEGEELVVVKGVNIDISEKKLAEESIKQQNERLHAIISALPDILFVIGTDGIYKEVYCSNPDSLLIPPDQIIGVQLKDFFGEERAREYHKKIMDCIGNKRIVTYEYTLGTQELPVYYESRLAPFGDEWVLALVRDITEKKQKESEIKKLSLAVDQSPVLVVITDLKANIEYVNPAFETTTGYSKDEVIGKNPRILKSGKTDDAVYANMRQSITKGQQWWGEWINKKKNGDYYWESVSITPVRDDAGNVTNYLALKQDISQRKQTEQEIQDLNANLELKIAERTVQLAETNSDLLKEIEERKRLDDALMDSEKSYRHVVENVNEVIFQTDTNGLWVFLNKSWEEVTGYTVEESLGQLFVNYVHPDDRQRNMDLFEPLINREKEYCRHVVRYLTKSGGFRWVEVFARLWLNDNNEITGTHGTLQDITERKATEEALLLKTSELENFFSVSLDLLCIADQNGNFIKVNKAWEDILGYTVEELESRKFLEFVHPDDLQPTLKSMAALLNQTQVKGFINRYMTSDGSFRFLEWHAVPIGSLIYAAARDITDRKLAEDFENELLQLSPKLTGLPLSKINDAIDLALSRIGQFLAADRSYIFEFDASRTSMSNTHEWCNTGINPEIENLQGIPCELLPRWKETLERHENIVIQSLEDLPESWQAEREILEPQGIQSLIVIPMLAEDTLIGFVGLDSVATKKEYKAAEINILKVWSSMLASLINNQRTENILEQTRQNFETFFNTIDDFLFIIDQEGNIIHTNNTVNNRLGFTKEELFDRSILSVHPPERREEAGRIVGEMLAGTAEYCPVPITTKSGQQIPVETRVKPGFWDGKPVIFGVTKDVSKIRLSEEKFSKAFQSNSSLMVISGFADKVFIDVNDMFLQTLGYSRDEIIGKTLSDFGFYADADVREALFEKLRMKIPVREIETRIFTKSGTIITGLFSADYLTIGNELCVLGVMVDITERKLAENEMIRQSGLITSLFDSIPDMIFFKDTKGYYLGCNPPFTEFVGKSRKDIIGKTDYDLFDKETADAFIYADRCTMAERNITLVEEWITYPDGHTVLVDTLKTPYSGSDGSLIGMLGISRDITDRKRNEEGIINQCRLVKQRHISA